MSFIKYRYPLMHGESSCHHTNKYGCGSLAFSHPNKALSKRLSIYISHQSPLVSVKHPVQENLMITVPSSSTVRSWSISPDREGNETTFVQCSPWWCPLTHLCYFKIFNLGNAVFLCVPESFFYPLYLLFRIH